MTFAEILEQVLEMLQRRSWVSYRVCKRQFDLDDASLMIGHDLPMDFSALRSGRLSLTWGDPYQAIPALAGGLALCQMV